MADPRKQRILKRLVEDGQKTQEFFRALSPEELSQQIYHARSGWTVREIIGHLLNAEQGFHRLVEDVAAGGTGAPEGIDIDDFNEEEVGGMDTRDSAALLHDFATARAATINLVSQLPDAVLEREGRHPFFGMTSVEKMLKLITTHAMIHQRDVKRALDRGEPVDSSE